MRNFFIWLLTPLARYFSGVHPHVLTFIAFITGISSGIAYWLTVKDPGFYLLGGLFAGISGICDSLDGIVSRMYGKSSRLGDFLDHFCDRVVDTAILIGFSFSTHANPTLGLVTIIIILLNSYQGTQIQASFDNRLYVGSGKAELFVCLVIFSGFMFCFPDMVIRGAGKSIALINLAFIILGCVSIISIFYRCYHVYQLYAESDR